MTSQNPSPDGVKDAASVERAREIACEHRGPKTGFVRLTMPVQHQRRCEACGETFWAIPTEMGANYRLLQEGSK